MYTPIDATALRRGVSRLWLWNRVRFDHDATGLGYCAKSSVDTIGLQPMVFQLPPNRHLPSDEDTIGL